MTNAKNDTATRRLAEAATRWLAKHDKKQRQHGTKQQKRKVFHHRWWYCDEDQEARKRCDLIAAMDAEDTLEARRLRRRAWIELNFGKGVVR
jgi:hypothetical protein